MGNVILLEGQSIQKAGTFTLQVDRQIEVNILAEQARRIINRFIHMEISTQLHAHLPLLLIGEKNQPAWRVPVHLTFPNFGDVGWVGFMYVDPITGEIENGANLIEALKANAQKLALHFTPPTA